MTVQSINQRVFEQANMSAAKPATAADEFAELLNSSASRVGMSAGAVPSAATLIRDKDSQAAQAEREVKTADKPERPEAKGAERDTHRAESKNTAKADKPKARDKADDKGDTKQVAKAKDDNNSSDTQQVADSDQADQAEGQTGADTQAQSQGQDDGQNQAQAAVSQAPQQEIQEAMVDASVGEIAVVQTQQQVAQTQDDGQQVVDQGPAKVAGPVQQDTKQAEAEGKELLAAADAGDESQVQVQAKSLTDTHGSAKNAQDDLKAKQEDDLAQSLNDTGAQLQVQVSVTAAQTNTAAATDADPLGVAVAQDLTAGQTQAQTANAGQNGQQGADDALAAATPAADRVQVQNVQAEAVNAKTFAAALAATAQTETAQTETAAPGQNQNVQAVGGVNGASGTQATHKAQAQQAPQQAQQTKLPQPHELTEQVSVQITKAAKDGHDTIKVQLKPVELGAIEIKLNVAHDGSVTGTVTVDNKDTLALLQKDSKGLERALEDAGLKPEAGALSFNLRGDAQQQTAGQNANSGKRRSRLGVAQAIDGANAQTAAAAQARYGLRQSGVDIQV